MQNMRCKLCYTEFNNPEENTCPTATCRGELTKYNDKDKYLHRATKILGLVLAALGTLFISQSLFAFKSTFGLEILIIIGGNLYFSPKWRNHVSIVQGLTIAAAFYFIFYGLFMSSEINYSFIFISLIPLYSVYSLKWHLNHTEFRFKKAIKYTEITVEDNNQYKELTKKPKGWVYFNSLLLCFIVFIYTTWQIYISTPKEIFNNSYILNAYLFGFLLSFIIFWNTVKWLLFEFFHFLNEAINEFIILIKQIFNHNNNK